MKKYLVILLALLLTAASCNRQKAAPSPLDFEMTDNLGGDFALADLRGNFVVLDFWATWCPDCRQEIPALKELVNEYEASGIKFVSVSFDTDKQAWQDYISEQGLHWTQVCNFIKWKENPVNDIYNITWIPTLILLDKDGNKLGEAYTVEEFRPLLETSL